MGDFILSLAFVGEKDWHQVILQDHCKRWDSLSQSPFKPPILIQWLDFPSISISRKKKKSVDTNTKQKSSKIHPYFLFFISNGDLICGQYNLEIFINFLEQNAFGMHHIPELHYTCDYFDLKKKNPFLG